MKDQIIKRFSGIACAWGNKEGESAEYFGFADKENNVLVDENTIFPACSISKFITAICVMKLHEKNLLDIDTQINQYLKQWKLRTIDDKKSDATIRSLMCHTSGILDGEDAFYGLRRGDPEITLIDILDGKTSYNNRPARSEKNPGTAFEYSDAGYCVLQLLVQEITQKNFEDFAREIIFDPIGLNSTFFVSSKNVEHFGNKMATPVKDFSWTGLGLFMGEKGCLASQGWGENGQCMLKMNPRTKEISIVMTNSNPGVDQAESGIEWLVNQRIGQN